MKHVKPLSRKPAQAQDLGIGALLSIFAEILLIIGEALIIKEQPPQLPTGGGGGGDA